MTHADAATGWPADPPRADQPTSHTPDARANGRTRRRPPPPAAQPGGRVTDWALTLHDAYQAGRQDQAAHDRAGLGDLLGDLAVRHADLATAWTRIGTITRQQRITRDLQQMADHCARINTALGRPAGYTYRGGPVDYDTGKPLTTPWQANHDCACHGGAA